MRVAKHNEEQAGRGTKLFANFREIATARMLWATTGIATIGLVAGFVFYNRSAHTPFQNQPTNPGQTAVQSGDQPATEKVLISEQDTLAQADVPAATTAATLGVLGQNTCQTDAQQAAVTQHDKDLQAENERFEQLHTQRPVRQVLFIITTLASAPSQEDIQQHDLRVQQIETTYQQALQAAHCS